MQLIAHALHLATVSSKGLGAGAHDNAVYSNYLYRDNPRIVRFCWNLARSCIVWWAENDGAKSGGSSRNASHIAAISVFLNIYYTTFIYSDNDGSLLVIIPLAERFLVENCWRPCPDVKRIKTLQYSPDRHGHLSCFRSQSTISL